MDTGTGGVDGGNKKAFNLHSRPSGHVGKFVAEYFRHIFWVPCHLFRL